MYMLCVYKFIHSDGRFRKYTFTEIVYVVYVWTGGLNTQKVMRLRTLTYTCGQRLSPGSESEERGLISPTAACNRVGTQQELAYITYSTSILDTAGLML